MNLMAASADLVMLYLAIETTSIPLYVLAGFMLSDKQSNEAGFKYLLFGAMTSAIMLYGFSLLFGFAGTTDLYELASMAVAGQLSLGVALGLVVLIVVGLGFKVSIVPFHFWAPDVYTGSPTPVAGFLSTASKAAGFAVLTAFVCDCVPCRSLMNWASHSGCPGDDHHDTGQPGRFETDQYQTHVGLLFDRACRLCHDRCGGRHRTGCDQRGVLPAGLYPDQPGCLWYCDGLRARDWL